MNKPANISLYSLVLMVVFFGIALSYQSCSNKKKEVVTDINDQLEDMVDDADSESLFEDDETSYSDSDDTDSDASADVDYTTPPTSTTSGASRGKTAPSRPSSTTTSTTRPSSTPSYSSSSSASGDYMVIAGNYLVESNAQSMVNKLKNAGYGNAEYAVFDLSQYRTVIAGRYSSRSAANSASAQLKSRGFDNYVLKSKE